MTPQEEFDKEFWCQVDNDLCGGPYCINPNCYCDDLGQLEGECYELPPEPLDVQPTGELADMCQFPEFQPGTLLGDLLDAELERRGVTRRQLCAE